MSRKPMHRSPSNYYPSEMTKGKGSNGPLCLLNLIYTGRKWVWRFPKPIGSVYAVPEELSGFLPGGKLGPKPLRYQDIHASA